jgi:hypothetical protein
MLGVRASGLRGVGAGSSLVVRTRTRWRMRLSAGTQVFYSARRQRSLERVFPTVSFSPAFLYLIGGTFLTFDLISHLIL